AMDHALSEQTLKLLRTPKRPVPNLPFQWLRSGKPELTFDLICRAVRVLMHDFFASRAHEL
ncbi:MAG: hypothetical protein AAGL09_16685, partial [Pseudomonadota bacterium]